MNQVTTVLTVVERPEYLDSQIDAIKAQTINSGIFIVWRYHLDYNLFHPAVVYKNESSHFNSLYGRFYNSLHIKTPYVFICDDDLLPGRKYIERCIDFSKSKNDKVVISSFGVKFEKGTHTYKPSFRVDQFDFLEIPTQVDMGGQGWFMKTDLLPYFLDEHIFEEDTGEDIHFSFCLFKNNIPIYVLDKDKNDKDTWQDTTLGSRGSDNKAQWRTNTNHLSGRDKIVSHYVEKGWDFITKKTTI